MKVIRVASIRDVTSVVKELVNDGYRCRIVSIENYAVCERAIDKHGDLRDVVVIYW